MKKGINFYENFIMSLQSIKIHKTRSILTILIIAVGITALVGILTSIEALRFYFVENFKVMGSNTITIQKRFSYSDQPNADEKGNIFRKITLNEAIELKELYEFPSIVSVNNTFSGTATLKYSENKTNPNISVIGCDENYLTVSGNNVSEGRFFSKEEITQSGYITVIGSDVAEKLFPSNIQPLNKTILIGSTPYVVIGVLEAKGSAMGFNPNNMCLIPLFNARNEYETDNTTYSISIMLSDANLIDHAEDEAIKLFRTIRKNKPKEKDSFDIRKSDSILDNLSKNIRLVRIIGLVISVITLFASSIALMNIMLISVTERTSEVGLRKSLGATYANIRNQFLIEAVVISQIGGIIGIILGILLGNTISYFLKIPFFIPWNWLLISFIASIIVALISGIIPATKAAKYDPIESLRYE